MYDLKKWNKKEKNWNNMNKSEEKIKYKNERINQCEIRYEWN